MPFDTIITIEIESAGTHNNAGEYTPGPCGVLRGLGRSDRRG